MKKIINIYYEDGINGLAYRLIKKLWKIKYYLALTFKVQVLKSRYGVLFHNNYRDTTFWYYIIGEYGFAYWNRISRRTGSFNFLDIGANQGLYTICAAKNDYCEKVFAFEPVRSTFELLTANVELNNVIEKCVLVSKAVSDRSGAAEIAVRKEHSGSASLSNTNQVQASADSLREKIYTVSYCDLNSLLSSVKGRPIVVKIDVEGHEIQVISVLLRCDFAEFISEIFFEVDEAWIDPEVAISLLRDNGFSEIRKVTGGKHRYDVLAIRAQV